MIRFVVAGVLWLIACGSVAADSIRLAVTTSFHNSGLSEVLLPQIKDDIGLEVHLLIVGTGQALKLGKSGDVDAILVHSKAAETAFVRDGYGTHRREIMYNDFVLLGPGHDPAVTGSARSAVEALKRVEANRSRFVSRGDDSGTHKKELSLWAEAGLDPATFDVWYNAVGAGMGASLNTASGLNAYILSDRASWLNFQNKGELTVLFQGDPALFNQYTLLPVNPELHPHVKAPLVMKLENWLTSAKSQTLIDGYQISGQALFTFNAARP